MEPSLTIGCNALELQPVKTRFLQVVFQPADPLCTIGCYSLEPRSVYPMFYKVIIIDNVIKLYKLNFLILRQ